MFRGTSGIIMTTRAAIILAGGKARRFQLNQEMWQDKALAQLSDKHLLIHAVESVRNVVDEVAICVNDETRKSQYSRVLTQYGIENIRLLTDEKIGDLGGPIVGIRTGLKSVKGDYCLTLPCDAPFLQPGAANYMFNKVEGNRVVVPMWPDGRLETLIMVCERLSIFEIVDVLCRLKRSRSDDIMRGASAVLFVSPIGELRTLDPDLKSFVNINSRDDLARLQTRQIRGDITENLSLCSKTLQPSELKLLREASELQRKGEFFEASRVLSSCSEHLELEHLYFWAGISRENEGKNLFEWSRHQSSPEIARDGFLSGKIAILKAAQNYELEARDHETNQLIFLAGRARADKSWCQSRADDNWHSIRYLSR